MEDIQDFFNSLRKHWGALVTGGSVIGALGIWQGLGHKVKPWAYWIIASAGLLGSAFFAWRDEKRKAEHQKKLFLEECSKRGFAVDSSGFSTSTYSRWFDQKYGKMRSKAGWVKAHLMVGVKTNIVTSIEMTGATGGDSPLLPQLLYRTKERFQVAEVSADKAYSGNPNVEVIVDAGAIPFIPFRSNTTGRGPELWRRLWHFYQFNRSEFLKSYHKRSNVESTFSMIKAKFGASVRSKTPVAQMNEVLCKVVCHNLCVLVHSIYELGIEPTFWAEQPVAQQIRLFG